MKFTVGDRVKVVDETSLWFNDEVIVIGLYDLDCYEYTVQSKRGGLGYFTEKDLELIEEDVCLYFSDEAVDKIANILKSGIKTKKQFQKELNRFFDSEPIEETKPIKQNRLEELINALNTLGSLGIELDVKITAEINGKKVEL